jgi:phosphoribosyl 1,2-cyclic phosphodiesterase
MLKNGSYPFELKKRIASDHGHLSNDDCGEQLVRLTECGVKKFILGHLSRENNTAVLAEKSAVDTLLREHFVRNEDYLLHIASPEGGGLAVEI